MPKLFIPFGEWTPDQPEFLNPGSSQIINALPRTKRSYGPIRSLARYSTSAMAARCQGAFPGIDSSGNVKLLSLIHI